MRDWVCPCPHNYKIKRAKQSHQIRCQKRTNAVAKEQETPTFGATVQVKTSSITNNNSSDDGVAIHDMYVIVNHFLSAERSPPND